MGKIRFPKSNSLKWVRIQDYSLPQSDDTRLYYDFNYTNIDNQCFFPKLQNTSIWQQFRTDLTDYQAFIVDENGTSIDITTQITDGAINPNGTTQFELFLDLSSYSGKYYFIINFTEEYEENYYQTDWQSEWFEIISDTTGYLKVEWINTNFQTYNDGIIWTEKQQLFIESRLSDTVMGVEKSQYTTENNKLKTTQVQNIKSKIWQLELIPDYLMEILHLAMQKGGFYINDVKYNIDGTFDDAERQGDTRYYSLQATLRLVEDQHGTGYEDYEDDPVLLGDLKTFNPFVIYAGEGKAIYADTSKGIGFKN